MARYTFQEASFDLPDLSFVDRTIHVLSVPMEGVSGAELGVFVHRAALPDGVDLRTLARAEIDQENRSLLAFSVLQVSEGSTPAGPLVDVATQWRGPNGMVFQRLGFVAVGRVWLLVGVNAPVDARAQVDQVFSRLVETLTPSSVEGG